MDKLWIIENSCHNLLTFLDFEMDAEIKMKIGILYNWIRYPRCSLVTQGTFNYFLSKIIKRKEQITDLTASNFYIIMKILWKFIKKIYEFMGECEQNKQRQYVAKKINIYFKWFVWNDALNDTYQYERFQETWVWCVFSIKSNVSCESLTVANIIFSSTFGSNNLFVFKVLQYYNTVYSKKSVTIIMFEALLALNC